MQTDICDSGRKIGSFEVNGNTITVWKEGFLLTKDAHIGNTPPRDLALMTVGETSGWGPPTCTDDDWYDDSDEDSHGPGWHPVPYDEASGEHDFGSINTENSDER